MKSIPIIMTAPSVRALLAGRKTMTRRLAWKVPTFPIELQGKRALTFQAKPTNWQKLHHYIQGGGEVRLWVKEGWWGEWTGNDGEPTIGYRADHNDGEQWKSPIFMPRRHSRITIVDVKSKMEPLIWITEDDARAEGLARITKDQGRTWKYGIPDRDGQPGADDIGWPWVDWSIQPRIAFKRLWNSIHGPGAWDENPYVVALWGRVVLNNIDVEG